MREILFPFVVGMLSLFLCNLLRDIQARLPCMLYILYILGLVSMVLQKSSVFCVFCYFSPYGFYRLRV